MKRLSSLCARLNWHPGPPSKLTRAGFDGGNVVLGNGEGVRQVALHLAALFVHRLEPKRPNFNPHR